MGDRASSLRQHRALDLGDALAVARQSARDRHAAPAAAAILDPVEIVAGGIVLARRRLRRRGHAHDRNAALWAVEMDQGALVVVAMNDELGPVPRQYGAKRRSVDESLE